MPRASLISRFRSGEMRPTRPMPKRRIAEAARARDAVDPGQRIGGEGDRQRVERAPALVAVEQLRVAEVEPEPRALDQHLRQGRGVAKAEIEALPGDRVDAVRGVADQREPLGGDLRGMVKAERIGRARRQHVDLARGSRPSLPPPRRRNPRR